MLFACTPGSSAGVVSGPARRRRSRHLVVDIHCHVHSPEADELVRPSFDPQREPLLRFSSEESRRINRENSQKIRAKLTSLDARLKDMDRMGVDVQALSPSPFNCNYWAEPELGLAAAKLVNDRIAEMVAGHPERFVGLCTVPLQAPELAIVELERAVRKLGLRGVQIGADVDGEELAAPRFRPFFARAEELGILIFLHPSGYTEGARMVDHYLINVIGNPLASTVAVSHLIFGGVLDAYPKLKLCVAHGGGYLPTYSGRMDHAYKVRPECRAALPKKPSHYLKKIHFDSLVFTPGHLNYLIGEYCAQRVLLGTDYPYDMAEPDPVGRVDEISRLKAADKKAILGGNAARLLGLKTAR